MPLQKPFIQFALQMCHDLRLMAYNCISSTQPSLAQRENKMQNNNQRVYTKCLAFKTKCEAK